MASTSDGAHPTRIPSVASVRIPPALIALALLTGFGCAGGERTIVEPPPPPSTDFVLTAQVDPEDLAAAQQLGWGSVIPTAEVRITPADSSAATQIFTTTKNGTADLGKLKAGKYLAEVRRLLSNAEISTIPGTSGIVAFVGADTIDNSSGTLAGPVSVPASRRRSLVINESSWRVGYDGGLPYQNGGYFELYNNSDTTIYLDGISIGFAFNIFRDGTALPCESSEAMRNDPTGVWSLYHQIFPGAGHDYPLKPGGLVTVAQDAIDHRPYYSGMPDLRGANFEFVGPADIDNPTVPNMIDKSYDSLNDHGMPPLASGYTIFLALPVDFDALPKRGDPRAGNSRQWSQYPATSILDAFSTTFAQSDFAICPEMINKKFDRRLGFFQGQDDRTDFLYSPSRKVIGTTVDGRSILQDTRTSATDFVKGPVTPLQLR